MLSTRDGYAASQAIYQRLRQFCFGCRGESECNAMRRTYGHPGHLCVYVDTAPKVALKILADEAPDISDGRSLNGTASCQKRALGCLYCSPAIWGVGKTKERARARKRGRQTWSRD